MVAKIDPGTAAAVQQNSGAAPLKCPRCDSTNTKFCYYNNYSLSQPRHFCKACKRYWTRGGTLRNVPVGGGCRKNKRHKKPHNSSADPPRRTPQSTNPLPSLPPPPAIHHTTATDLSSLLYGLLPLRPPPSNSTADFFPKHDLDAQLAGYEENFLQSGPGNHVADLQRSPRMATAAGMLKDRSLLNSQISASSPPGTVVAAAESYCQPLLFYDDNNCRSLQWEISKENPLEAMNSFPASAPPAAAESSYLYWNQLGLGASWPETGFSVAPLI